MNTVAFLTQKPDEVARSLIGWQLISCVGPIQTGGIIVETEAYGGTEDAASHARNGETPRTRPMFGEPGTLYLYRSYGIHICVNLVTGPESQAGAVLIRALKPETGLETIMLRRRTSELKKLTTGPGNVGQALGLTLDLSGTRLGHKVALMPPHPGLAGAIKSGPRIGISKAQTTPWRFWLSGSEYVSRP